MFFGAEKQIICCVIQPRFPHRLAGRKRVLNLCSRLSSVVVSSFLLTHALLFSNYSLVHFLHSESFLRILTALSNVFFYALMQISADKCVGNFTFSVPCMSIKWLCTKVGPTLYIYLYSKAIPRQSSKFRHISVAATTREGNTTDQNAPLLEGVSFVMRNNSL